MDDDIQEIEDKVDKLQLRVKQLSIQLDYLATILTNCTETLKDDK